MGGPILFYLAFCALIGALGNNRPFGFWGYFFASMFLTPFFGVLLLCAAGSNRAAKKHQS